MFSNKNIKSVSITRDGKKFLVSWEYIKPVVDDEGNRISTVSTSANTIYEALAHFIDPLRQKFNFETLAKEALLLNSPLDPDWEFVDEFAIRNKVNRKTVYEWLKQGKLESMKLNKYTLVRYKAGKN